MNELKVGDKLYFVSEDFLDKTIDLRSVDIVGFYGSDDTDFGDRSKPVIVIDHIKFVLSSKTLIDGLVVYECLYKHNDSGRVQFFKTHVLSYLYTNKKDAIIEYFNQINSRFLKSARNL